MIALFNPAFWRWSRSAAALRCARCKCITFERMRASRQKSAGAIWKWPGAVAHTHPNNNIGRGFGGCIQLKAEKMAAESKQNLQDAFLNNVRKAKVPVTIFLMNGVKLQGVITWFDNFCVLLRRDGQSQLVYKHAISTVMPSQPITLYEAEDS